MKTEIESGQPGESTASANISGRGRKFIGRLASCVAGMMAVLVVLSLLSRVHWRFELACHFLPLYLAISAACAVILGLVRRWRWFTVSVILVVVTTWDVYPYWIPAIDGSGQGRRFRVLFANVHSANQDYSALLDLVESEQPDVIALAEINDAWANNLETLRLSYPHGLVEPRRDNFGIAILSKHPMHAEVVSFDAEFGVPSIVAEITLLSGDKPLRIVVTHPVPPVNRRYASSRDKQLQSIANYLSTSDDAVLLVGDLNVTPWSPRFADLCGDVGLTDARTRRGIMGTWPSGWFSLMRLPLDHVLSRGDIDIVDLRVGPNIGSDHLPVIADVR